MYTAHSFIPIVCKSLFVCRVDSGQSHSRFAPVCVVRYTPTTRVMPGSRGWRGMRSQETARAMQGSPRVRVMRSQQTEYIRIQEKLRVMPTLSLRSSVRIKVQLGHLLSYTHSTRVGNFQHVFAYSKLGVTCASTKTGEIRPQNLSSRLMRIYQTGEICPLERKKRSSFFPSISNGLLLCFIITL